MSLNTAQGPYFGGFGGRFVAESLMGPLEEVEAAWRRLWPDPGFQRSLRSLFADYAGRPSLLTEAPRFASDLGGVRVLLKREDLNHTGSHKINNVLGQALLTRELGKTRVIAETGAGQHGVATATAAALMGLECTVYMGKEDTERQALNVARMQMLGAEVVAVSAGSATLKDAINEAFRDWVTNAATTNYVFGTAAGPHPFPELVRDLQRVIGDEARAQLLAAEGRLPDVVCACVGGGSNAIGAFTAFLDDPGWRCWGARRGATVSARAATRRRSPPTSRASSTAPAPSSSRSATGRRSPRTRSPRDWTTRAWAPSTRGWQRRGAPRTPPSPTARRWTPSRA